MKGPLCLLFAILISTISFSQKIKYTGSLCEGGSLALMVEDAPSGSTYQWTKDGIKTSTSATYTITSGGTYEVTLTSGGNTKTLDPVEIKVKPKPIVDFTFAQSNQCPNAPVFFTNTSSGTGLSYTWDFGDVNSGSSNTSTSANPIHRFKGEPGNGNQTFTVKLTATSNDGCSNSKTVTVTTKRSPDTKLVGNGGESPYDNKTFFKHCTGVNSFEFTFVNQSSTTNTFYRIVWGDGSPDFSSSSFSAPQTHTYKLGTTKMLYIVTGQNGCTDTAEYHIFVGSNPAVGLGNPGNTTICTGSSLTFPISNTASNPPGTFYKVTFNDGTPPITYQHPAPADVTHIFNKTSCGTNSDIYTNSFSASIQASNACNSSSATVVPIYVSQKPQVSFTTPKDSVCVNNIVTFTNTSGNTSYIDNGQCINGKSIWSVSPASGWNLANGSSLGNDYGLSDPSMWLAGSANLSLNFTTPGIYTIKLKTGNPLCGNAEITKTICVNPQPIASFTVNETTGCGPLSVKTTNTSPAPNCGNNSYIWAVTYSTPPGCTPGTSNYKYINGTSANSINPEFQFINPGVYTISLTTRAPGGICHSTAFTKSITVKDKPTAVLNIPSSVCQNGSINPTASVPSCVAGTSTYAWSFPGGTPSTGNTATPGPITYNTAGGHNISLTVTNECGTTTVSQGINVTVAPNVTVPANQVICAGTIAGGYSFTSSVSGTSYTWTNSNTSIGLGSSGMGNIPSFSATNNTNTPVTATITVTPRSGCTGPSGTFTITVNPKPIAPKVTSSVIYCQNETATALKATPDGENTLAWYDNSALTNGSSIPPVPSTNRAGITTYYVTQDNGGGCKSSPASIQVTVLPAISNNNIGSNQTLCTGGAATPITQVFGSISGGNGSYTYQWEIQREGSTIWEPITNATSANYMPGALSSSAKFRRIVYSGQCASSTSNEVTISVQGSISNSDISGNQTICTGTRPTVIQGQEANGGSTVTYQWESSEDQINWKTLVGGTGKDFHPSNLNRTTHFRRKTISGACSVYSTVITITVNPKPVIDQLSDKIYCNDAPVNNISFTSTPSTNVSYKWENVNINIGLAESGTGNIPGFTATNTSSAKVPLVANIGVVATYTNGNAACEGSTMNFKIIVLPKISIKPIDDVTVCAGSTISAKKPEDDAGNFAGSSVSFSWTISGQGISLTNGSGNQIPSFSATNNSSSDQVATITVTPNYHYNGQTCAGNPFTYTITVKPGTAKANAGSDMSLCAVSEYSLNANIPTGSTTGAWRFIGTTDATLSDPSAASALIKDMTPGKVYQLEWTLSGHATCPPTKDTVVITNYDLLTNTIDLSPITICEGQEITIQGQSASGGNNIYQYQWQESIDGNSWTAITGQTGKDLFYKPTRNVSVRRNASAGPCQSSSLQVKITVQPGVSNNTIASDQTICTNNSVLIKGSQPSGGDNQFTYTWEQSIDNGNTWTPVSNAFGIDYQTPALTQTTKYRRRVATQLCSGPQQSSSNSITVTVNPDARALIAPVDTLGCPPFAITAAMLNHQPYPQNNKGYQWYVNNELVSTSVTFPGYAMLKEDDTITLKLKAVSLHGCLDDSISYRFYTYPRSIPDFTLSESSGCGPLQILITNTTPKASLYKFEWDFGNGLKTNETQPGTITFQPNPTYGDTTYHITMRMLSPCDTTVIRKSVLVKSKPKVLFSPSKSVGCSPMRVVFNNTSLGKGNLYTWDFGDGTTAQASTADTISHTFVSGVRDTFYVKLKAVNECGEDALTYAIVVSPNQIYLDFALNGNEQSGCAPHTVRFINNSKGASNFRWDFGDGNILSTNKNIDTITHTYQQQGNYTIQLWASNGCSDTTTTEKIAVYTKPMSDFSANTNNVCIGDTIRLTNASDSATSFLWSFGDGNTSTLVNPIYKYRQSGNYNIVLKSFRTNSDGTVCSDSISQAVQVVNSMDGWFDVSDSVSSCAPLTVTFNNRNQPSVTAVWDFGDGTTGSGNNVTHTFTKAGTYSVKLTAVVPGGCTYITYREIRVLGPSGTVTYQGGYLCNARTARFQADVNNTDSIRWDFGDGNSIVTAGNVVYHTYLQGGKYLPSFTLLNKSGCGITIPGTDTIKVDKLKAGFTTTLQQECGTTTVIFMDTTNAYFGNASALWSLGDGRTGNGFTITHKFNTSGSYPVQLIVNGVSGCADTITRRIDIKVNDRPVAAIEGNNTGCTNTATLFRSNIQSIDSVSFIEWTLSNGAKSNNKNFTYIFTQTGTYTLRLIAGTINGCFDTTEHSILINASPIVKAGNDQVLCLGRTTQLHASGTTKLTWQPFEGLSCTDCPSPLAAPKLTTTYVVQGTNALGCSAYDTVLVTVIQPMKMVVSLNDSICIGQSANLLASGATTYSWSPAASLNSTTVSNPVASPSTTTTYRVVGYDGFNCFTDTAYVTVAVGQYPKISLGPDMTLSTGTLHPLTSTIENGPIRSWKWTPTTDLSCVDCPRPVAHIKKDITYVVEGTTAYGCSATDSLNIKVFCENSQLFIPNAFTPDGDGANDILMVRGKGIASVKTFRIFNRWGEVVFERGNFIPNDPAHGWDGKVKGVVGPPDVFVYTAEVICENGATYTYKGNVSIIK